MKAKLHYDMSKRQREAMNREINAQICKADSKYKKNIDVMILYALHKYLGFGKKRLKRFFDEFNNIHNSLREYYEMEQEDLPWLCEVKLKEIGVDVEKWEKETERSEKTA